MSPAPAQHRDVSALRAAITRGDIVVGEWQKPMDTVRMMTALLCGSSAAYTRATQNWPDWLTKLHRGFFYRNFSSENRLRDRAHYSLDLAHACLEPIDFDHARDRFLYAHIVTGRFNTLGAWRGIAEKHDFELGKADEIEALAAVLRYRFSGEGSAEELAKHWAAYERGLADFLRESGYFVSRHAFFASVAYTAGPGAISAYNKVLCLDAARQELLTALAAARTG